MISASLVCQRVSQRISTKPQDFPLGNHLGVSTSLPGDGAKVSQAGVSHLAMVLPWCPADTKVSNETAVRNLGINYSSNQKVNIWKYQYCSVPNSNKD